MTATYELATTFHNFAGDFFQNTFAYELSEAGSASPFEYADALITAWLAGPQTDYLSLMGIDCLFDFISAKKITAGGGPTATQIVGNTGGMVGKSVSSGVALDIAWQTASGTNRPGHSFITGGDDTALDGGQWQSAYLNLADNFIGAMLTPLTLAGGLGTAHFGVYSRKLAVFNEAKHGIKKPKPTMMNKRTMPVL